MEIKCSQGDCRECANVNIRRLLIITSAEKDQKLF